MEITTPEPRSLEPHPPAGVRPEQQVSAAWQAHGRAVMRFATALVGPHDAHDVATNAFLRVVRQPGWNDIEHLDRYWMRAVRHEAQNLSRERQRRWQRALHAVTSRSTTDAVADPDVIRAIGRLSVQQRAVVFLAYWHQMTEAEIADTLDLARSTVHRNLIRARIQLRKALR